MTTELKRSDFSKICRTCLLQKDNMEPIYKSDIPKMLLSFTNIKVDGSDDLPKLICSECAVQVDTCYSFKQRCESTEKLLRFISENCLESEKNGSVTPGNTIEYNRSKLRSCRKGNGVGVSCTETNEAPQYSMRQKDGQNCSSGMLEFHGDTQLRNHRCRVSIPNRSVRSYGECDQNSAINMHTNELHCANKPSKISIVKNVSSESDLTMNTLPDEEPKCEKYEMETQMRDTHRSRRPAYERLCNVCGKTLKSKEAYGYHMRIHTGERPYKCDLCEQRFNGLSNMHVHRRSHTGVRNYKCTFCEKAFMTQQVLVHHIRTHTGERPYVCHICSKAFAQKIALKTHAKTH